MKTLLTVILFFGSILFLNAQDISTSNPNGERKSFEQIKQEAKSYYTPDKQGKGTGYKVYKRWEFKQSTMLDSEGYIVNDAALLQEAMESTNFQFAMDAPGETHGHWSAISSGQYIVPGDDGIITGYEGYSGGLGRVNRLAFHPTDANIIYASTPAGGLWKTTSGGNNWLPLTDGMTYIGVTGIAIHPLEPNIIYIATGDGDGRDSRGIGVLKSFDGGSTWQTTGETWGSGTFRYSYNLKIHPVNHSTLILTTNKGCKASYNSGETWQTILSDSICYDIEFKPDDPSILFVSGKQNIFRFSTDVNGEYQLQSDTTLTILPNTNSMRTELAICPSAPNKMYAIAGDQSVGLLGVYQSLDGGLTWDMQMDNLNILDGNNPPDATSSQSWYDMAIIANPTNGNQILSGAVNTWKSVDGGLNWTIETYWDLNESDSSLDHVHADFHGLYHENGAVYACNDGGVFKSVDLGETWEDISGGLNISQWYNIDVREAMQSVVLGGCQDNGTNKISGSTILQHMLGGDGMGSQFDTSEAGHVFSTKQEGEIFESYDDGLTNDQIGSPPGSGPWVTDFVVDITDGDILFYGGVNDVFRWEDDFFDGTWTAMNCGVSNISAIDQSISNTDRVVFASDTTIRRTSNAHSNTPLWLTIDGNIPMSEYQPITDLKISPISQNDMWITKGGWNAANKTFFTDNGGLSWTNMTLNLPNIPIYCVEYDPLGTEVYIGTAIGVFYLDTAGSQWIYFSNGLPNTPVRDLNILSGDLIVAATYGRGIWQSQRYASCEAFYDLTQSNDPNVSGYTGFQTYEADVEISSTRIISGGPGTEVNYQAGEKVDLKDGFHVVSGSFFKAKIGACDGGEGPE